MFALLGVIIALISEDMALNIVVLSAVSAERRNSVFISASLVCSAKIQFIWFAWMLVLVVSSQILAFLA